MKILVACLILLSSFQVFLIFRINNVFDQQIKISREREDLLLQTIKLLDYQIDVLTNEVIK